MKNKECEFLIVTPVLNAKEYIGDCIESVKASFNEFSYSHVIVDGGSNDGSIEIIENLKHRDLYLIRQPQTSMYEAINCGLNSIEAKYFYQLNADDLVLPHAPGMVKKLFDEDGTLSVVSGATLTVNLTTNRCRVKFSLNDQFTNKRIGSNLFINQPSTFVRYHTLKLVGGFNESYRYASDTELWLRLINKEYKCKVVDQIFSIDRLHSRSARLLEKHINELQEVRSKYYLWNKSSLRKFSNYVFYSSKQLTALILKRGEVELEIKYSGSWYFRMMSFFLNNDRAALELNYPFYKGKFFFWGRLN